MELELSSLMKICLLMGLRAYPHFLFYFILLSWVWYMLFFFPSNALFAINFKQSINHHKRKTENTMKEENYLKDMFWFLLKNGSCSIRTTWKKEIGRKCKIKLDVHWSREGGWDLDSLGHKVFYLVRICHGGCKASFMKMPSISNPLFNVLSLHFFQEVWNTMLSSTLCLLVPLHWAVGGLREGVLTFSVSYILLTVYQTLNLPT